MHFNAVAIMVSFLYPVSFALIVTFYFSLIFFCYILISLLYVNMFPVEPGKHHQTSSGDVYNKIKTVGWPQKIIAQGNKNISILGISRNEIIFLRKDNHLHGETVFSTFCC